MLLLRLRLRRLENLLTDLSLSLSLLLLLLGLRSAAGEADRDLLRSRFLPLRAEGSSAGERERLAAFAGDLLRLRSLPAGEWSRLMLRPRLGLQGQMQDKWQCRQARVSTENGKIMTRQCALACYEGESMLIVHTMHGAASLCLDISMHCLTAAAAAAASESCSMLLLYR